MVVGAFPAAKLGTLLLKQISKPIANVVKNQAKSSPVFRKYVCMPPAQFYNWCEVTAKMWILNLGKPVNIPVLNEAMAIELGANLLGEGIIFAIAAGILISEYTRSVRKETAKEEEKKNEMELLQRTIKELFIQSEEQGAHIRELTRKVGDLDTKVHMLKTGKAKDTKEPPEEPPPSSLPIQQSDLIDKIVEVDSFIATIKSAPSPSLQNYSSKSLVLVAANNVRNDFWNYAGEREDSILTLGLCHLYQNVFRINL